MPKQITFAEFEQEADKLLSKITKIAPDIQELAINNAKGLLLQRAFNKGGSKGVDGNALGQYTPYTKLLRAKKGYQTSAVDLQQTKRLKDSIQTGKSGDAMVMGFLPTTRPDTGKTNFELAQKLEKQYGEIFSISDSEEKKIDKSITAFINKQINL